MGLADGTDSGGQPVGLGAAARSGRISMSGLRRRATRTYTSETTTRYGTPAFHAIARPR